MSANGTKRTNSFAASMSANDPKQTYLPTAGWTEIRIEALNHPLISGRSFIRMLLKQPPSDARDHRLPALAAR